MSTLHDTRFLDERLEKIRRDLPAGTALLVTSDVSRKYLYNFRSTAGYGYISADRCILYLDFRYTEKARRAVKNGTMSPNVTICEPNVSRREVLSKLITEQKIERLLFEDGYMTFAEYTRLQKEVGTLCELVPVGDGITRYRAVKDEAELSRIEAAQAITDAAFSHILGVIRRGMTEREIVVELEHEMFKRGADGLAFDTICVSGKKSSMPHGEPDDTVVWDGFLTLDFGAAYDGYCSDMTRTVCIGQPTDEMRYIYDTVLEAQNAAFKKIRGGLPGNVIDGVARDLINKAGFEGCFGHSLGHSLGLEIHESPNFSPRERAIVPAGAVISVEPGVYIAGKCGVRIEDIVFLTENGYKNLTKSTKEFIILP